MEISKLIIVTVECSVLATWKNLCSLPRFSNILAAVIHFSRVNIMTDFNVMLHIVFFRNVLLLEKMNISIFLLRILGTRKRLRSNGGVKFYKAPHF